MNLKFKTTTASDCQTIFELAQLIWNEHYVPIIGKNQVEYMLKTIYSEPAIKEQMQKGQEYTLVYCDEKPIGYFSISKNKSRCFLHKLYVLTDQQNKGIGGDIMKEIITKCSDGNFIELTVNRQNFKSINFYFKHGFKIKSVEDFDIGNGFYMNDFVMEKIIK